MKKQTTPTPMISVIVATYQREDYLRFALESITKQTYRDFEIIVIDDGSTDSTKEIISSIPDIRYFYQENSGVSVAKNRGVARSRGSFIAFLDSDDLWHPEKLEKQMEILNSSSGVDMVFCHAEQFIDKDVSADKRKKLYCPVAPMPALVSSTVLISRRIFDMVGDFDTALRVGIDVDWYLRAKDAGLRIALQPETLFYRRIHPGNSGYLNKTKKQQHAQVIKAHLERMRAAGKLTRSE